MEPVTPRRYAPAGLRILAAIAAAATLAAPAKTSAPRTPDVEVLVSQVASAGHSAESAVTQLGGTVIRHLSVIDGFAARLPRDAVPTLAATPGVRWVSPDRTLHMEGQYGQDSGVASAVYTDVIRATKTWGMGDTGAGVTVAVVDTGVNTSGDLSGQVVHAEDFTNEQNNADTYGHGTFVAGLIAGTGAGSSGAIKGVAPGAKIVSLKIAGADGTTDVTRVLEALEWIVDFKDAYGIRVVNLSLGFSTPQSYLVDPLDFAVERVWNAGVVVVAAAGNGNNVPGSITAPGNDPFVITAGSSNDKTTLALTDDKLATFSSVGPTLDGYPKPEVLAPGRSVVSSRSPGSTIDATYPDSEVGTLYAKGSGTSFSSAIVSGVAALVIQRAWSLSPNQVKYRMTSTTRVIGGTSNQAWWPGDVDAFGAAMSLDLSSANQGIPPSIGGGSLQATRGAFCLQYVDGTCMTDADADAALGFDPVQYFADTWAGSQWLGSQWLGSQWTGSQWTGSQWTGSQWMGANSDSSTWAGSQWVGSQWLGSQWLGSQWLGSQWVGSQWVGSQWLGTPWVSDAWGYIP
jgi:serine protease AprX